MESFRCVTLYIYIPQTALLTETNQLLFVFPKSSQEVGGYTSTSRYDKKVTESRKYNSNYNEGGVDTSPIIKVSSMTDNSASRRDSWDAIAKTRNILSDRSLESLANLTESQLDTDLRRRKAEEHSRFLASEQSYRNESREHNYKTNYTQNYSTSKYNSSMDDYGRSSPIYRGSRSMSGGAGAVKVQPVPDGILGQPVEFESKYTRDLGW